MRSRTIGKYLVGNHRQETYSCRKDNTPLLIRMQSTGLEGCNSSSLTTNSRHEGMTLCRTDRTGLYRRSLGHSSVLAWWVRVSSAFLSRAVNRSTGVLTLPSPPSVW